ncbi:hypothetical protein QFC19_003768 [Naganishia cerealis]|uniref:Uncharacterized protein n=1 Tax=Naganishia cerealis TaxID=610337 RepID=A0ACC2W1P0_9TREE|nr:hypothetical protein QFC19_003768 [Naganishia cerealis]
MHAYFRQISKADYDTQRSASAELVREKAKDRKLRQQLLTIQHAQKVRDKEMIRKARCRATKKGSEEIGLQIELGEEKNEEGEQEKAKRIVSKEEADSVASLLKEGELSPDSLQAQILPDLSESATTALNSKKRRPSTKKKKKDAQTRINWKEGTTWFLIDFAAQKAPYPDLTRSINVQLLNLRGADLYVSVHAAMAIICHHVEMLAPSLSELGWDCNQKFVQRYLMD